MFQYYQGVYGAWPQAGESGRGRKSGDQYDLFAILLTYDVCSQNDPPLSNQSRPDIRPVILFSIHPVQTDNPWRLVDFVCEARQSQGDGA